MKSAAVLALIGLLMWFSQDCLHAAAVSAGIFASGVMPALFPLMVIAGLPLSYKRSEKNRESWRIIVEVMSFAFAAGSPAGARRVFAAQGAGRIDGETAIRLYVATGVVSPLFFLGSLSLWTGNGAASLLMLAAHWLAALLTGALCCFWRRNAHPRTPAGEPIAFEDSLAKLENPAKQGLLSSLPMAIAAAAQSLLSVCGAMMLFSIAFALAGRLLALLFPTWVAANPSVLAVLHALLEIGGGAHAVVGAFPVQGDHLYAFLCALCSFGGLSIWMQNLTFAGKSTRPAGLLLYRAAHGAAAYGVCRLLLLLWPQTVQAGSFLTPLLAPGWLGSPLLPLGMLLTLGAVQAFWQRSKTCSPHS